MAERNCGNCNYCAENGEDLVCVNQDSEYASDYVEEAHTCDEWNGYEEDDEN